MEKLDKIDRNKSGADCGADHQILLCKLKLNPKTSKSTMKPSKYDLENIPSEFSNELKKPLVTLDASNRVSEELWNGIKKATHEVCGRTPQKVKK